jgi:hypothetical protein
MSLTKKGSNRIGQVLVQVFLGFSASTQPNRASSQDIRKAAKEKSINSSVGHFTYELKQLLQNLCMFGWKPVYKALF